MRRLSTVLWLLAILSIAPTAAAQEDAAPEDAGQEDADEAPAEYQSLIEGGLRESAEGRWEEARAYFHRAHAAYPNARTLRGIGVVSFELRDYVDAVRHLRRALTDPRRPLTDAQREEVEALLERAHPMVASYDTEGLRDIVVDGHRATIEPDGTLLLAIGPHDVRATGDGRGEARLIIRGGEDGPLPVVLSPPDQVVATATPAPVEPRVPEPVDPRLTAAPSVPAGGIALAVGGGVAALTGIALLIAGLVDVATVQNASPGTEWQDLQGAYDRAPILTGLGIGLTAIGIPTLLGGVIWITTAPSAGGVAGTVRLGGRF